MEILFILFVALLVVVLLGLAGLRIQPRVRKPELQAAEEAPRIPLPLDIPEPLRTYIKNQFGETIPQPTSVTVWGNGQMIGPKLPGISNSWIPMSWTLYLVPGQAFVWHTNLSWFGITFLRGGDELRKGHGRFMMGNTVLEKHNLDLSEDTILWLHSLLFAPTALLNDPRLRWEAVDEHSVRLIAPYAKDGTRAYKLCFDEQMQLIRIETQRTTTRDARVLDFQMETGPVVSLDEGIKIPGSMTAAWENDPYQRYTIQGISYRMSIDEEIERGLTDQPIHEETPEETGAESELPEQNTDEEGEARASL